MRDRATKAPFDPDAQLHARVKREAMARGLMCYPMGGTVDGRQGDHILLAPPFIVAEAHLDLIVERLHGGHRRGDRNGLKSRVVTSGAALAARLFCRGELP